MRVNTIHRLYYSNKVFIVQYINCNNSNEYAYLSQIWLHYSRVEYYFLYGKLPRLGT